MIRTLAKDIKRLRYAVAYALLFMLAAATAALADDLSISVEINKGAMIKLDRPAASVVLADPGTADVQVVSPKLLFVHGKKVGETSLYAIDGTDNPYLTATINVTHNISSMTQAVKRVVPDADVSFRTVDGGLMMDGFTNTSDESQKIQSVVSAYVAGGEKLINMIKTSGSDQVMLKVKLVEMSRTNLKRMGVNLQNVSAHGNFAWQVLNGEDILFNNSSGALSGYNDFGNPVARGANVDAAGVLHYKNLTALVEALETRGLAHVLAEPSLTTTSGQAASFLAGGQFPLPITGNDNTVTLQYQTFGVSLNFTPIVMSQNRISMTVAPEVSTLNFNNPIQVANITYPILETRRASSVVELGSGDSFVMAGLLKNEVSNTVAKFPGLGDLPILGTLFRSTQFQNNETELVIIVTPYIVHPVAEANRLQTPIDGYKTPSDYDLYLNGEMYQQEPMDRKKPKKDKAVEKPMEKAEAIEPAPAPVAVKDPVEDAPAVKPPARENHAKNTAVPGLRGNGGFILD